MIMMTGEYSWWRTDQNGKIYQNKIKNVNGWYYAFDRTWQMQTGFVLLIPAAISVAQYVIWTHVIEDFIGWKYIRY